MGSEVDKVAVGWISLQVSSGDGTIDSLMSAVPRDPNPKNEMKKTLHWEKADEIQRSSLELKLPTETLFRILQ